MGAGTVTAPQGVCALYGAVSASEVGCGSGDGDGLVAVRRGSESRVDHEEVVERV